MITQRRKCPHCKGDLLVLRLGNSRYYNSGIGARRYGYALIALPLPCPFCCSLNWYPDNSVGSRLESLSEGTVYAVPSKQPCPHCKQDLKISKGKMELFAMPYTCEICSSPFEPRMTHNRQGEPTRFCSKKCINENSRINRLKSGAESGRNQSPRPALGSGSRIEYQIESQRRK